MRGLKAGLTILLLTLTMSASVVYGGVRDLKQQVQQTRAELRMTRKKWHAAQQALQQLERKLAAEARALAKINDAIYRNKRAIRAKKRALVKNKQLLKQRMSELSQSLRGISQWLNEPPLKWVINGSDPDDWSRLATYHHLIGHSQQQLITELKALQQQILIDEKHLEELVVSLQKEQKNRQTRLKKLKNLQSQRKQIVAKLRSSVEEKARQLKEDEEQLQSLLEDFSSWDTESGGDFSRLKGRLNWPVKGKLRDLFGQQIYGSELTWRGTLFEASQDRLVRAVAPGRVVYADWMSGYGWLVIIEHDHGYMTLYGRNHYLYKEAGQTVRRGEVIARSGSSGGFKQSALYFSIRHNGRPLNPTRWLRHK